ncbi:MAG: histidine phosphatase family protein [Pseudomonadota bacterium]|nr:histidine phosphatase family protein [Pseudomonadota bacterium]
MNDPIANRRRVYLFRHGDVRYYDDKGVRVAEPDLVSLTDHGHAQARQMGELMADLPFDRAFCTGLLRTEQTARGILGGRTDPELGVVPGLREIRSGDTNVMTRDEVVHEFVYAMEHAAKPGMRFARGEAFADFYGRVTAAIEPLLVGGDWKTMLLVAHGGTNRAILSWLTGGGLPTMYAFEQDTCCLNIFDVDVEDGAIRRKYLRMTNYRPDDVFKARDWRTTLERTFAQRKAD